MAFALFRLFLNIFFRGREEDVCKASEYNYWYEPVLPAVSVLKSACCVLKLWIPQDICISSSCVFVIIHAVIHLSAPSSVLKNADSNGVYCRNISWISVLVRRQPTRSWTSNHHWFTSALNWKVTQFRENWTFNLMCEVCSKEAMKFKCSRLISPKRFLGYLVRSRWPNWGSFWMVLNQLIETFLE